MRIYRCPRCGFSQTTEEELWECPHCSSPLMVKRIDTDKMQKLVSSHFTVTEMKVEDSVFVFKIAPFTHSFNTIKEYFEKEGYYPFLRKKEDQLYLILTQKVEQGKPNVMWNIILFLATIATTIFAGYYLSLPLVLEGKMDNIWVGAVSFSAAIMFILGTHEMGHKWASHKNGVDATWPYFIPMPFIFIGTMGALIKSRSPMPNNNSMIQLGAAGPLCGFLVAIPVFLIGMKLSYVVPSIQPAEGETFLYFGQSILTQFLGQQVLQISPGYEVFLHPIAIAAWAAFLVTSVNLIPVGQLDGGHIVRAILGERLHRILSYALIGVMVVMGFPYYNPFFVWEGWLIWALVLYLIIMRARSGGAMNELEPISLNSKLLALAALVVFIITVIPIPIGIVTG